MEAKRLDRELADMPDLLRAVLRERFRHSPLAYHNVDHIDAMLDGMERWFAAGLSARDLRVLRHAIWLHDAVYDVTASDNERRSADLGRALLILPSDELDDLDICIMATRAHATEHALARILVDLDLAVLAWDREDYRRYALAIRDEYRVYSDADYRAGRDKVLEALCAVPLLRRLSAAQGLDERELERRARANMRWEQARLRSDARSVEAALTAD